MTVPSDFQLKSMNALHRIVSTLTFGRVGNKLLGMPVLELTTTGRKSGEPRTCYLTSPLQLGDDLVIVASRGGDDHHPAWFLNLRDDPDVKVKLQGGAPMPMKARTTEGDERAQLWDKLTADHDNYAGYQKKTDREIPVVVLTRSD